MGPEQIIHRAYSRRTLRWRPPPAPRTFFARGLSKLPFWRSRARTRVRTSSCCAGPWQKLFARGRAWRFTLFLQNAGGWGPGADARCERSGMGTPLNSGNISDKTGKLFRFKQIENPKPTHPPLRALSHEHTKKLESSTETLTIPSLRR